MTSITSPFRSGLLEFSRSAVLRDYRIAVRSRHASTLGRREVLTGRAKFGIFGDGKEVAQLAMAYAFKTGDIRSGYYRDQTFMLALEEFSLERLFAQLYAHAELDVEPSFAGRAMNGHFATRMLDEQGRFLDQVDSYNSAADLSPTAGQMPRLVGLGYASRLYRDEPALADCSRGFSKNGSEIAFGTIGNASCAEGLFWESVNAIGVLQAPVLLAIWDDGYGISVPNRFQIAKSDVSKVLEGFRRRGADRLGIDLHTVPGWDYPRLCETFLRAADACRRQHVPAIVHVTELTQPLGHSTSGSHERYKSSDRLAWEREHDCLVKMRAWILAERYAESDLLDSIENEERQAVVDAKDRAWDAYRSWIARDAEDLQGVLSALQEDVGGDWAAELSEECRSVRSRVNHTRRELMGIAHRAILASRDSAGASASRGRLIDWYRRQKDESKERYGSELVSSSPQSPLRIESVKPEYDAQPEQLRGYEIMNICFDRLFERNSRVFALGEDVGQLGDVNQGFANLQEKYGALRIADTGIREATILGQAIGMALRGLRPIAEIQYLDYVLYALQGMSDDLATLRWRTRGGQAAPVLIRTRGHRLEGIWHSGSLMAGIIHLCRGMHVCVPRDSTRAAGFYNLLIEGDDPALIVEVLNGYRRKEPLPSNLGEVKIPLGVPETLRSGRDVTVVTYGALCTIAEQACDRLDELGISVELIDVQTLLPFDVGGRIVESLQRTHRVLFLDEDVPGGTSAYMMRQVLEVQGGYDWLDSAPRTLCGAEHRPAYGNDGDYFSKPNVETITETVYAMMRDGDPRRFPSLLGI